MTPESWYATEGIPPGSQGVRSGFRAELVIGRNAIYISLWSYGYDYPPFYNLSRCTYAGGVYALGKDGKITWSVPTRSRVIAMGERNDTVYYGTSEGDVSAARIGIVAGILAAIAYVFTRFVLFGAVARDRTRLNQNANRNDILQYIVEHPGSSPYDISRGLKINQGTMRYHLSVLSANHRVVPHRADDKYVRYFVNSGRYSERARQVISLLRRSSIRRTLTLLAENPGLSNLELSQSLGVPESRAARVLKELSRKGIVTRGPQPGGKVANAIKDEYCECIADALRLVGE